MSNFPRGSEANDSTILTAWLLEEYGQATAAAFTGWKPQELLGAEKDTMIRRAGQDVGETLFDALNTINATQSVVVPPSALMKDRMLHFRVATGIPFTNLLNSPLPFKIPIQRHAVIKEFPNYFEYGLAEYTSSIDTWLDHRLLSYASGQAVVIFDGMWQSVIQSITSSVAVLLDEDDFSSQRGFRPVFTALYQNCLVMKGEAKASLVDMMASSSDLIKKFHKHAYKLFPKGCDSIPGIATCNEVIAIFSLVFYNNHFTQPRAKEYRVAELHGRTEPTEGSHLVPDTRTRTRNGHHITLLKHGLLKEFDKHKISNIRIDVIRSIYDLKLPNVEHGWVNCKSVTITRVGSRLKDAVRVRNLNPRMIYDCVKLAVSQLHFNGYAHCDICVDNIFVDSQEDGGAIFLGDLEHCRAKNEKPPADIRRADPEANTAEQIDLIQLEKLKDELALI